MSEIDKRVVQMVFDNEDFEKNIAKSKKSLESMDDSLDNIEKSVSKRGLEKSISESIEKSEIKIQAFKSMIDTVVSSITSTILGAFSGIQRAANHLTFDQAIAGFEKYTSQLESVQTITNAVQYNFQDLATAVGYVEEELDKLNWFTDQTSYNFSDMASNIGKFTAVGVDLEEASSAMQGIANWAGLAGQNAASASRAMYNLAQAMSAGKVQLIDWKSIQNANMDTQEFRKIVYNVAKARADAGEQLGGLDAEWFKENDANAFFSDLKKGGFTKDVLMDTLQIFSAYSDEVHRMVEAETISVDDAMKKLDKISEEQYKGLKGVYDNLGLTAEEIENKAAETGTTVDDVVAALGSGGKELKKQADELGISIETALNVAKLGGKDADLGWQYFDVAKRAFHAAQEYKTFKDVVDATADAVSTAWMRIYKTIFGNYLEAKEFWTELGGIFDDVFGGPVYAIEDIVKTWRDFSGREMLIGIAEDGEKVTSVFQNLVEIISTIGETIGQAFLQVNPFFAAFDDNGEGGFKKAIGDMTFDVEKLGKVLAYYTIKLRDFVAELKESILDEGNLDKLRTTARGFFIIVKNIGKVFYSVFRSVGVIVKALLPTFDTLIGVMNSAAENEGQIEEKVNEFANTLYRVANVIAAIIKGFKQSVLDGTVVEYMTGLGKFLVGFAAEYIRKFVSGTETEASAFIGVIKTIGQAILGLAAGIISGIVSIFDPVIEGIMQAFENFAKSGIGKSILTFISEFGRLLGNAGTLLLNMINGVINLLNIAIEYINTMFTSLGANEQQASAGAMATIIGVIAMVISFIVDTLKEGKGLERMEAINDILWKIEKAIGSFTTAVNAVALKEIGKAIALLAVSMLMIAAIPKDRLAGTLKMVAGILITFLGALALISSMSAKKVGASGLIGLVKSFQQLATGLLIMSSVIIKLMKVDPEELVMGVGAIAMMLGLLTGFIAMLTFIIQPGKMMIDAKLYEIQINGIVQIMKSSIVLALMINVLRSSITSIGGMEAEEFSRGLIGLGAIIVAAMIFIGSISVIAKRNAFAPSFGKILLSLAGSLMMIGVALNLIMVPLAIMSVIPIDFIANGIVSMGFIVGYIAILFKSLAKFSKNANEHQASTVRSSALVIMSLAISMNLMFVPLMLLSAMSAKYSEALEGGLWAFTRIIALMLLFVGGMRVLASIGNKSVVNAGSKISIWVDTLELLARDMMLLAASVTAFMVPVIILGILSKSGIVVEDTLKEFAGFLLALFTFSAFTALLTLIPTVEMGVTKIALAMFGVAGAFAMLGAALYAIVHVIKMIAENMEVPQFQTASKKLSTVVVSALAVIGVVAGVSVAISKLADRRRTYTVWGSGKSQNTVDTTLTIGQEILALGTGLTMIAMSLATLMIPLRLILQFSPDEFDTAGERMLKVVAALAGFISVIMIMFGLMSRLGGNNSTGWSQTITRTPSGIGTIFKSGQKRVSVNEATSFGANMKELGKALMLMAASLTILVVPMKLIGMLSPTEFDQGFTAVVTFLGLIAAIVTIFGYFYGKTWDSKKMTKFAFILIIFTGAIAVICTIMKQLAEYMTDPTQKEAMESVMDWVSKLVEFIGIISVIIGFIKIFKENTVIKEEKTKPEKVQKTVGQLLGIAAIIGALGAALTAVMLAVNKVMTSTWSDDWSTKLIVIAGTILVLVGIFALIYGTAGKTVESSKKSLMVAGAVATIAGSLVLIAGAITMLTAIPSANVMSDVVVKLSFMAAFVAGIFVFLGLMANKGQADAYAAVGFAIAVAIVSASLLAIAGAMVILSKSEVDGGQMISMLLMIIAIFVGLGALADVTNAGDLILSAAAFAIVAGGIVLLATSMLVLADAASKTENGFADLWEGVSIIITLTAVGVVLVAVISAIAMSFKVFGVIMAVTVVILALLSLSFLMMAAAIWLVVQSLIDLGGHWNEIEKGLDNITDWLMEHKITWAGIITGLFSDILNGLGETGEAGKAIARVIGGAILGILKGFISLGQDAVTAALDNTIGEVQRAKAVEKEKQSKVNWFNARLNDYRGEDNTLTDQGVANAINDLVQSDPNFKYFTLEELQEFITKSDLGADIFYWDEHADAITKAFYDAGGSLFTDEKWWDQYNRHYAPSNNESTESDNTGVTTPGKGMNTVDATVSGSGLTPIYNEQTGELIGFMDQNGMFTDVRDSVYARYTGYTDPTYAGIITDGTLLSEAAEDISLGAGMIGDGAQIFADANEEAAATYGAKYAPITTKYDTGNGAEIRRRQAEMRRAGATPDQINAQMAQEFAPGQAQAAQAGAEIYGNSFMDTLWSFFANNGDMSKTLWSELGKTWAGQAVSKIGEGIGTVGTDINNVLKENGIDIDWKQMGSDAIDSVAGYLGFDTSSEDYKKFKDEFSVQKISEKGSAILNDTIKGITVDKKDPWTALKDAAAFNGFSADTFENDFFSKLVTDALGVNDLFGGEGIDFDEYLKGFKIEGVEDASSMVDKAIEQILGGDENPVEQVAKGAAKGAELEFGNFDPQTVLDKYGYGADDFYNYGFDSGAYQALGQTDGYDKYMKDFDSSKYTADLDKYKTSLSEYGLGKSSESNLIWRGYGRNGEELWAPSKEDMYNNLVKPIRDGFEWHGWDAKDATPWKAVETAADAMKDAAETEKTIITDANKQRWQLDEAAGKWYAIDENGKRINKTDAEGKESPWSVPAQKQDAKIQNGVWVWDATNKQWILTVNGKYADLGNGIQLADTKSGILDTPTLTDAQYQALTAKMANDEKKKTADQRKNDLLYGDLDKKIQSFTDKSGKQLYYGGKKVEATDYYTGEKKTIQKKYALRGKKLAGYDNAYALVDEKGNLIFNSRGERITFTVDKTNGVKLMSESMTQAANTMNEAGKEVQNAAKNPNTKAAMYGASTALTNAEATKDVYSTAVVHNQDTGLVESKYNNNVVAQNQSNQQAQDATQSAKSAIDHLQEINSKMTEVRDLMISNNMMLATIEALNMNMDKSMKDVSARPFEFNIDGKKVAEATKGFMNKSLGVVSRMGGRQVAT